MTAPSVDRPGRKPRPGGKRVPASPPPPVDPPAVQAVLASAVEEAARLLGADGAFLYRLDEANDALHLAHAAGVNDLGDQPWVRRLVLPMGVGMFGKAVAERRVQITGDYTADQAFVHAQGPDRIVRQADIRSLVVAPMLHGDRVYGAIGTFSSREDAFSAPQVTLVRALAEHAGASIANVSLIAELDRSREDIARRAEAERTLREIGTRLSAARDPAEVVQRAVDEALRLLDGDGARIDLIDPRLNLLRGAYVGGAEPPDPADWPDDPDERLDEGVSGKAVVTGATFLTGDYLHDERFVHGKGPDGYVDRSAINSAIASPLIGEDGPIGALTVWARRRDAFDQEHAALLEAIAGQAAVALGRARLIEELGRSREALARRADEEQALREIAGRLSAIDDPTDVLQRIVREMRRLLGAERARLDLVDPVSGRLLWTDPIGMLMHDLASIPMGKPEEAKGLTAQAIAERRAIVSGDYLADERFEHYEGADREALELGLTSVVVVPVIGDEGLLGVLQAAHQERNAFRADELRLVEALAAQASIGITNARLVDQLATSQEQLALKAETERALREIAVRLSVIREPGEVLQSIVDEAHRLIRSDSARIDLVDADGHLHWEYGAGGFGDVDDVPEYRAASMPTEDGLAGLANRTRRPQFTGDYLADDRFVHGEGIDAYMRAAGVNSVLAAPLLGESGVFGSLYAVSQARDAFGERDAEILAALASQAAVAITNARLVEQIGTSERQLARTAAIERSLREIAERTAAMRDPRAVLEHVTQEAARLLGAPMAIIDLNEPDGSMSWGFDVGVPEGGREAWYTQGLGNHGSVIAMATRRPVVSADYATDERFEARQHAAWLHDFGVHSWAAAPLLTENAVLGTISVISPEVARWDDADGALLQALADQAAIATTNARLIDELGQSKEALAATADSERALREIAARLTAIREPREVLQRIVDEARRLAGSDLAYLDRLDTVTGLLKFEVSSGDAEIAMDERFTQDLPHGHGLAGLAISERRPVRTEDYLTDDRFIHPPEGDDVAREEGIRSVLAVPLLAEGTALGVLSVASRAQHAFDEPDQQQLVSLADQAAIAIRNSELVRELAQSREESARRADTERTLRELAARVTAIRDPEAILGLIVEEARRVLGSDGAHLTRISEDGTFLRPVVVAGGLDTETREWLLLRRFPVDGGINGLAAGHGRVVSTPDYRLDPRIPREPDDLEVAERLGLGAMAAAPLRAPGGDVIGTLAVNYRQPGRIVPERLDVLQSLADHAAIAVWNSDLLLRLEESELSYRRLVQTSPDVIWRADAEGTFTFFGDNVEQLLGFRPDELLGRNFIDLIDGASLEDARERWRLLRGQTKQLRVRLFLHRKDGTSVASEVAGVGVFEDGVFVGAQGSVRDVSERERLERELRDSEARFRNLVENSPDLVWEIDLDGRFTYVSDSAERLIGVPASEMLGRPSNDWIDPSSLSAMFRIGSVIDDPHQVVRTTLTMIHRDGSRLPFDIRATGLFRDGELVGVHGASRDVSERVRLERELRESEKRYRFLIENSPDVIWSLDAEGRFTFITESVEQSTGWAPSAFLGRHFNEFTSPDSLPAVSGAIESLLADPERRHVVRIDIPRPDGTVVPTELSFVGMTDEHGRFAGVQGSSRDVSERERLEAVVRESESRYRSLVQSSPDLIFEMNGEGLYTFFSARSEDIIGWHPDELIGKPFTQYIDLDTFANAEAEFARFRSDPGTPTVNRMSIKHKDGSAVPFEVSAVGQVEDGQLVAVRGVARDIRERERLERELRGSEERYRYLVQSSPDMVWVTDTSGRFTFVSDTTSKILGWQSDELLGRSFEELAPSGARRTAVARFKWLEGHPTQVHRTRIAVLAKDGREVTMEITGIGMVDDGVFVGAHGAARDVSERERLERELRESEATFRYLVKASPLAVWEVSPDGVITYMSDRFESLTGWRPSEVIGRSWTFLTSEGDDIPGDLWEAVRDDPSAVYPMTISMPTKWGERIPVEVWMTGRVVDGRFGGAHGSIRDLRERERLERDLRTQAAELASGEERAHLARELHDSVTQALFSMTLLSRSIELLLVKDPSQVPAKLVALRELQKDALAEMRALIFELRPGNVEESGLIGALKTHTAGLAGRIGLPVVLDADLETRPPIEVEETLYRIAQEALHNTVKHAGAHQVRIEVDRVADGVRLKVVDDGRGFDPATVPDGHLGLAGMRARAEKLGGSIAVKSAPGQGTSIEVVVPESSPAP